MLLLEISAAQSLPEWKRVRNRSVFDICILSALTASLSATAQQMVCDIKFEVRQNMLQISNVWRAAPSELSHFELECTVDVAGRAHLQPLGDTAKGWRWEWWSTS
jgi:hypothetical protein